MGLLEAIVIGIIQGLTEFLPVSSSGHIELAKAIFGDESVSEEGMLFTILVHAATALSTVIIFWKDIVEIFKGIFKFKFNEHWKFSIAIVISMIPAGAVGVLFKDELEAFFYRNVLLVGLMLLVTGLLLFLADKAKKTEKDVSFATAAIVGIAQAIAIMPGISRSGATIGTSVLLGIDKGKAARFSFLMVIPLICGAMLLEGKKFIEVSELEDTGFEGRVEMVVNEAKKEGLFEDKDLIALQAKIEMREEIWDVLAAKPELTNATVAEEKAKWESTLTDFSDQQVEFLVNDKYAGFRPLIKTSNAGLIGGFLAAFLTGLVACKWMIKLVKKSQLKYFSFYCFIVGIIAIVYAAF